MRDRDPNTLYMMVVFDSEDSARAREKDPRRQDGLKLAAETIGQIFEGSPEFTDLNIVAETIF
jgi:hypothetical protein